MIMVPGTLWTKNGTSIFCIFLEEGRSSFCDDVESIWNVLIQTEFNKDYELCFDMNVNRYELNHKIHL